MSLEDARRGFYAALEGLKQVHTREQLETQKEEVERLKKQLLEIDPEFRAMIEMRKREAKMRADQARAEHKAKISEAKMKASTARAKADSLRRDAERRLDDFDERHLVKKRTFEEAEKAVGDKLACRNPKCPDQGKNRGNMLNNVEWCFMCNHRLIAESEASKHNRAYWRRFNRKRKKKGKG